jgi:4a-hydroxytetrahydrobiopterin dehydratase
MGSAMDRKMEGPLAQKRCIPCEGGIKPLPRDQCVSLLKQIPGWTLNQTATELSRAFTFSNFHETMEFVNAVAWISHHEDHHPDLEVHWGSCLVRYSTHAIKGLSDNDFICAAKVDALFN